MNFLLQGKSYQAVISSSEDLMAACALNETHWVATSAPVAAFRMDAEFLRHLDTDQDQRVKAGELKSAVVWTLDVLRDSSGIDAVCTTLHPKAIRQDHPDGRTILPLLESIAGEGNPVSLAKIRKWRTRLEARPVSEAGVVLPEAADREDTRRFLSDLLRVMPGADHPSGKKGVNEATLDAFLATARDRLAWLARAESDEPNQRSGVRPLGADTSSAFAVYRDAREAMDRFYALCDVVSVHPDALSRLWPGEIAAGEDAESIAASLRKTPLAEPNPEGVLRIDNRVNPAYAHLLHELRSKLVIPFFDRTDEVLSREDWLRLRAAMETHAKWQAEEPGPSLAPLGASRLREMLESRLIENIRALISSQAEAAVSLQQVRTAEKLALFQGNLLTFANNFISFPLLYTPDKRASFEEGTLIMDGRRFNLAVRVPDRAAYLKGIEGGTMYIMIVRLEHPRRPEGLEVAVPATSGRQGNLKLGKQGIFQDVEGKEWFATVVHISPNPISLTEAMFAPFARLGAAVTRKVESVTQSAEKKLDQAGESLDLPAPPPPAAPGPAANGQMLAGGGIALAALGSSLAFMTKTFAGLSLLEIIGGLLAAILAVLVPSAIIAMVRLSRRDLSVLLEGSGWAVNQRMTLNRAQRLAFTARPRLPKGSALSRPRVWWLLRVLWVVVAIWLLLQLLL